VATYDGIAVLMEIMARPGELIATNPPAVAFSSVMGICGLGLSWRTAGQVLAAPRAIGESLIAVGVMLFIVLSALYGIKTLRDPDIVTAQIRDSSSAQQLRPYHGRDRDCCCCHPSPRSICGAVPLDIRNKRSVCALPGPLRAMDC
jgi:hypothetical protein